MTDPTDCANYVFEYDKIALKIKYKLRTILQKYIDNVYILKLLNYNNDTICDDTDDFVRGIAYLASILGDKDNAGRKCRQHS